MWKILISDCLLGRPVRYDGRGCLVKDDDFSRWFEEGRLVGFCPEMSANLGCPRPASEINFLGQVVNQSGEDLTDLFQKAAELTFEFCKKNNVKLAILKEKSPSCGVQKIYDGTFSGKLIQGMGITASYLKQNGIPIFSDEQIQLAKKFIETNLF